MSVALPPAGGTGAASRFTRTVAFVQSKVPMGNFTPGHCFSPVPSSR